MQFTGYGKNGDLKVPFWSTKDAGQKPFTFKIGLGQVIKGWDEGVAGMDLGEVARVRTCSCIFVAYSILVVFVLQLPRCFLFSHTTLANSSNVLHYAVNLHT